MVGGRGGNGETVLAKITVTINLSAEGASYLHDLSERDQGIAWLKNGTSFLSEFRDGWDRAFRECATSVVRTYYRDSRFHRQVQPRVRVDDSHSGSWVIVAALVVGYRALRVISASHGIYDGLVELKKRLRRALAVRTDMEARKALGAQGRRFGLPPPQPELLSIGLDIQVVPVQNPYRGTQEWVRRHTRGGRPVKPYLRRQPRRR